MDDDQLNDLKQFIAATVSQATADMATKEDLGLMATKEDLERLEQKMATKEDLERLEQKVNDLDLKIDTISEALHESLSDHDSRIAKLEQQAA